MNYISTRSSSIAVSLSQALQRGLAPDGGLYVPESFPRFTIDKTWNTLNWPQFAQKMLFPFFATDETTDELSPMLEEICQDAFNFPIPLRKLQERLFLLELFHGPTLAFKDIGAQFLAASLSRLVEVDHKHTVLVATSGDTGGAVASAFFKRKGFRVVVLFPEGKVSPRQEKQLTCWGENIQAISVQGDFDDCQKIVKSAFQDPRFQKFHLLSANSINIGRLLPQSVYYAKASVQYFQQSGQPANFIIPSGNLGNSVAAMWAKKMNFPIGKILLATNANTAVPDYFFSAQWKPKTTIVTMANAMDVGNPSNMERLLHLYPDFKQLKTEVDALSISDEEIALTIQSGIKNFGEVFCPHTATAIAAFARQKQGHWIVVATAHPAKFESIVESLMGKKIPIPESLARLLKKPSQMQKMQLSAGPDLCKSLYEKMSS